jgi:hypothetical protein
MVRLMSFVENREYERNNVLCAAGDRVGFPRLDLLREGCEWGWDVCGTFRWRRYTHG